MMQAGTESFKHIVLWDILYQHSGLQRKDAGGVGTMQAYRIMGHPMPTKSRYQLGRAGSLNLSHTNIVCVMTYIVRERAERLQQSSLFSLTRRSAYPRDVFQ